MRAANDDLGGFVQQLDSVETLDQLKAVFSARLQLLGIEHYIYHIIRASNAPGRLPYILSTYPVLWIEHYFAAGYLDDDPIVGQALHRQLPFSWSEIAKPATLSERQQRILDEARAAGVADGLTIPLTGHGVEAAYVSLVAPGKGKEAEAYLRRHRHLLHLMALYFHAKAGTMLLQASLTPKSSRRRSILTPREREVLEWVARGKSAWEIASILEISQKSIEFHVDAAKRKLQVFNRTHAVVKAMVMGLISTV